jgi:hypothetical protein
MTSWNQSRPPKRVPPRPYPTPIHIIPTFHILIATVGRPCLKRMLDSLKDELTDKDAITIVFDGEIAFDRSTFDKEWIKDHRSTIHVMIQSPKLGCWGHGIRNQYQGCLKTKTTYLMHADDDDVYVKGSFSFLRQRCISPHTLYIGCMKHYQKDEVIPPVGHKRIEQDKIGTPCGIIPFEKASMSVWKERYGGDFDYYQDLQPHVANTIFLDYIIYHIPGILQRLA